MSMARYWLARAGRAERQIIEAMRQIRAGVALSAPLSRDAVEALASLVHAAGELVIGAPSAPRVTVDERRLVAWLSALQRDRPDVVVTVDPSLAGQVRAAASVLRDDYLLPLQLVHGADCIVRRAAWAAPRREADRAEGEAARRTLRARAVDFVRERGRVSARQLGEIGLSHQYLAALRDRGILIRVRHGFYEAPPPAATPWRYAAAGRSGQLSTRAPLGRAEARANRHVPA